MTAAQYTLTAHLRVLADETRLRILRLVSQDELSVGEIARCLAVGQSRVSNHLKVLRESGLLAERHEGSRTLCRLDVPQGPAGAVWTALTPSLEELEHAEADRARLAVVLAERATDGRDFFDRIAGAWDTIGSDFSQGTGRLQLLGCLVPRDVVVADIGCGTGYMAAALTRRLRRVICVDNSAAMLDQARANLSHSKARVEFRQGDLEALPLEDGEVDAAVAHMVLHHLAEPRTGLSEMVRIVKPGGQVACIDLLPHNEGWMREAMADTRLGIEPESLIRDFESAGLEDVRHELLDDRYVVEHPTSGRPIQLPLYLVQGVRPDDTNHRA